MKKSLLYTVAAALLSTQVLAGGYQLQEYSLTNLGRAFGGSGLVGDDYSAIAFNPAGMGYKKSGVQVGAIYADIKAKAHGQIEEVGQYGVGKLHAHKVLPHLFAQAQVNDKVTVGAGVYVPFDLGTYYDKNWFGEKHALNSEISALDVAASASLRITDNVSLGGSVFAEKLETRLTNTAGIGYSDLNTDDWSWGYNIGLSYEPVKDTRLGVVYRSKTVHDIKGPHYFNPAGTFYAGECGTRLILPEHVLFSAYQKVGNFGLSAMARWTRWSRFSNLRIYSKAYEEMTTQPYMPTVKEDWRNVWMVGAGSDYYVNDNWTLRAGVAYDQGAVKRSVTRTARVPDSNRWIFSTGFSYMMNNWQIDMAYMHMFLRHAYAYNKSSGTTLDAKYSMGIDMVGMSFQYNF